MFDPSQPPLISETLLKKRRSLDELALRRSATAQTQNKRKRIVRGEDVKVKRPEQFIREARIKEGSLKKMNRRKSQVEARNKSSIVPKSQLQHTVGFAVRIHGGRHSSELIKAELRKLGLQKKYDAVFFKLDNDGIGKVCEHVEVIFALTAVVFVTTAQLKPLDAYIAYGYITNKSVVELVHRRAYYMSEGVRKPLSDNLTVEKALGDKDLLCLNDLSHEIHSVGPHFESALKMLCPFKLACPVGHYEKNILHVNDKVEERGGFLVGTAMEEFLGKIL